MYSKYPQYGMFIGLAKGLVTSQLAKRSREELRKDIDLVVNMFKMCQEADVDSDDTGHITENR